MMDTDWLKKAVDAFHSSTPYMDSYLRPQWEKNLRQWQSKHRSESKYESEQYGKSKLFRPRTRATIRKNEAAAAIAYLSNEDVITVEPDDENNPQDVLTADIVKYLIQKRLTTGVPWFHLVVGAYQTAQVYGSVISYQYWDKDKDKPCIDLIPPENFRIDPASDWIDPIGTSPYLIHEIPMYISDIRDREDWFPVSDSVLLSAQSNYDSTRITREKTDTKSGDDAQSHDYSVVWVRRYIVKEQGIDWVFYTLGDLQLLSNPVPIDQVYWHGDRPYVKGCCVIEAFKPNPAGVPELTSDVQDEINDVCNQRMDNVKLAMNKRYFARRGVQVDLRSLTRNIPGSVTLMNDPEKDVVVHSTPDVTSSSFQEQDRLNLDFDDLAGSFSGSSIQANRKLNETVGGMNMLSQSSNQVAEYQLKTFNETWVEPVLRQLAKLELMYESDINLLSMAGNSSDLFKSMGMDFVTSDMLSGNYKISVNVGTGAANPQTQVEKFFYGLNTLAAIMPDIGQRLNTEEVIKEVFGKLGYKDGKRFFNMDENPQVAALTQQIQELQMQLMNKRNPIIDEAQAKLIDAQRIKTLNEAQYNALQTAATIVQVPGTAPVADVVMQNSGYQPPSPMGVDPNFPIPQEQPMPNLPISPNIGQQQGMETNRISDNV